MACYVTQQRRVCILYKTILRLHRGLPLELRKLGDMYAKNGFKRHKKCNEAEAAIYMVQWTKYAVTMSEQLGLQGKSKGVIGETVLEEELQDLRDEQVVQPIVKQS